MDRSRDPRHLSGRQQALCLKRHSCGFVEIIFTEIFGKDTNDTYRLLKVPGTDETVAEFFKNVPTSMYTLF